MSNRFWYSDPHFGHEKILTFLKNDGTPLRNFSCVEEMDEYMVDQWNKTVSKNDTVNLAGDITIQKRNLPILNRLNGRKILIMGNHDNHKIKNLVPYFADIRAIDRKNHPSGIRTVTTHVPIHTGSIGRWGTNIHGHTHAHSLEDPRYFCVCVEQLNYKPIEFTEMIEKIRRRNEEWGFEWENKAWVPTRNKMRHLTREEQKMFDQALQQSVRYKNDD